MKNYIIAVLMLIAPVTVFATMAQWKAAVVNADKECRQRADIPGSVCSCITNKIMNIVSEEDIAKLDAGDMVTEAAVMAAVQMAASNCMNEFLEKQ